MRSGQSLPSRPGLRTHGQPPESVYGREDDSWEGGYALSLERGDMTPKQLETVSRLSMLPSSPGCAFDGGEAAITVLDEDGSSATYYAIEHGGTCGSEEPFVQYEVLEELLESADCFAAQTYDGRSLDTAVTLRSGSGCSHGLFNAFDETRSWWFFVEVAQAGKTHEIAIEDCRDRQLSLALYDESGEAQLAQAVRTGNEQLCPALSHRFEEVGTYALEVNMTAGEFAGDFYLSVNPSESTEE